MGTYYHTGIFDCQRKSQKSGAYVPLQEVDEGLQISAKAKNSMLALQTCPELPNKERVNSFCATIDYNNDTCHVQYIQVDKIPYKFALHVFISRKRAESKLCLKAA